MTWTSAACFAGKCEKCKGEKTLMEPVRSGDIGCVRMRPVKYDCACSCHAASTGSVSDGRSPALDAGHTGSDSPAPDQKERDALRARVTELERERDEAYADSRQSQDRIARLVEGATTMKEQLARVEGAAQAVLEAEAKNDETHDFANCDSEACVYAALDAALHEAELSAAPQTGGENERD